VRPIRSLQFGRYHFSPASGFSNLGDDGFGFGLAAAIVNQNLRASVRERQGTGASYAAGSSSDKGRLSREHAHDSIASTRSG
jgi:hypothetical protein